MNELRKDYILDRWVIIAAKRGRRPHEFKQEEPADTSSKDCQFCPGSEHAHPPETDRVEKGGKWIIRVFTNKFAAVEQEGDYNVRTDGRFFTSASAYGSHEIIVETPRHGERFCDLAPERIKMVLETHRRRMIELGRIEGVKYVSVFKNSGRDGGASIEHEHSQVIAYNKKPTVIMEQEDASLKYMRERGACPYCDVISIEKSSERRVAENSSFVCFTPYASRFAFEAWFFPKRHVCSLIELDDSEMLDLAHMLKHVLSRLHSLGSVSYNIMLHNSAGGNLHFHIVLAPRLAKWAGFEFGTGTVINTMPPEKAAEFYRGEG